MDLQLQAALDEFSVLAVWSAITIYVLAFLAFAYDLSQRASAAPISIATWASWPQECATGTSLPW